MSTIAVIGAGLSGLVVSRKLAHDHDVVVFEKSRGFGGRMATRRAGIFEFDHGAQFFTARSRAFRGFLEPLIEAGVVADWRARFAELRRDEKVGIRQWDGRQPHYVCVPGMNAVGKALASGLDVRLETAVRSLARKGERWQLLGDGGKQLGEFDWVIVTAPSAQMAELLASTSLASAAANSRMQACCTLLIGFEGTVDLSWQAALVEDADISWISVNSSKPGRPATSSLVVHSTNHWADANIDDERDALQRHLADEVRDVTGIDPATAAFVGLHRWRYANSDRQDGDVYALDTGQRLAACGDWFVRGRVEGAFTSARALAERILQET
jgi:predicted NAD/FAD-dependent oxidoreductase